MAVYEQRGLWTPFRLSARSLSAFRRFRTWTLWANPRRFVVLLLGVDFAAVLLTAARVGPVNEDDIVLFGMLGGLALAVGEQAKHVERRRRQSSDRPQLNLTSVWTLAGAVMLPPMLAIGLVVLVYWHLWRRGWYRRRGARLHRLVYSVCVAALACHAASVVDVLAPSRGPADVHELRHVAVLMMAAAVYSTVNFTLIAGAIAVLDRRVTRRTLAGAREHAVEGATLGLGILVVVLISTQPLLVLLQVPVLLLLHRVLLLRQLEEAAAVDPKTGLFNLATWHSLAEAQVRRAVRTGSDAAVLMVDLDHFKKINDIHGHLAGDAVLRALAEVLPRTVRRGDIVGRFGGEEFVVLCTDVRNLDEARLIGERICQQVRDLVVLVDGGVVPAIIDTLTASVGVAVYSRSGPDLRALLQAADDAVFVAKYQGRNRVCSAVTDPGTPDAMAA